MSVKVIALYDAGWLPNRTDRRMWDHLCRAYGAELQMVESWDEAEIPEGHALIVFDQIGTPMSDFKHPKDAVYAFGRSRLSLAYVAEAVHVISIETPNPISLFGISAGSIALEDRNK